MPILVGAVLAGAGGYGAVIWYRLSQYPHKLATVALGDSKEEVLRKMGEPDKEQSRPDWLWCNVESCESEFRYGTSLPPS